MANSSDCGSCGHHGHSHSHAPKSFGRAFAVGIVLNTVFVIVEVTYGLLSNSLALIADAGHNLGDILGLVVAWIATVLARRVPTDRHTYGLRRSSVLAALSNAIILLVSVGAIAWEAVRRFSNPGPIVADTVIFVSLVGVVINTGTALMFMSGRKGDLNIRGAFLHMAADAAISLGVAVSGVFMLLWGWVWLDPVISLTIVAIIVVGTWDLLKSSVNLALDAVPENIDVDAVRKYLLSLPNVVELHHFHIWGISTTEVALTVHLVFEKSEQSKSLLQDVSLHLRSHFKIGHSTIQCEYVGDAECVAKDCR